MERMMSAEDVFELEQKRIHEDLTRELRRQLAEEQKRREEEQKRRMAAELELERLRILLADQGDA